MRAVYLQSVRSPAYRGQYKMACHKDVELDVFSQVPEQDTEYMEDSFCVANDVEDTGNTCTNGYFSSNITQVCFF